MLVLLSRDETSGFEVEDEDEDNDNVEFNEND